MDEAAAAATGLAETEHGMGEAVGLGLRALRAAWGDVLLFGHDERGFWAATPSSGGWWQRADTPEELGALCVGAFEAGDLS